MSGPPSVLLVGHDGSRTGAPAVAERWLAWAVGTGAIEVGTWLAEGGPLLDAYSALGPARVGGRCQQLGRSLVAAATHPSLVRLGHRLARPTSPLPGAPIVLANTLAAWSRAVAVTPRSRLVLWVHELDHVADRLVPEAERSRLLARTDHVLAVGPRVEAMLLERWRVPAAKVSMVPSSSDPPDGSHPPAGPHQVVGVGSLTARKGPDAFVAVVAQVRRTHPAARAAWIGGPTTSPTAALVRRDIARSGAAVELLGEVAHAPAHLPADGLLLHTAREDPDPLAVLEAAARGIPVVTWDTGGAADLLRDAGVGHLVADAGDLLGLAERVRALLDDPGARHDAGRRLAAAARTRTTETTAPRVLDAVLGEVR